MPKMVPGGHYLLLLINDRLECQSTVDGRCIWQYHPEKIDLSERYHIVTFNVDLLEGGQAINVIVGIHQSQPLSK
jgi:hypothetical protein